MNKYRLRAECLQDVLNLINLEHDYPITVYTIVKDSYLPDVELTFECEASLDYLKLLMSFTIEDSHVMRETLNYEVDYTGERTYDGEDL